MTRKFDARLKAVEKRAAAVATFSPVREAIRKHLFYDELSEPDRALYCEFIGIDRVVLENITLTALGDIHFILREIEKPTPEELQEIIVEVEEMVEGGSQ